MPNKAEGLYTEKEASIKSISTINLDAIRALKPMGSPWEGCLLCLLLVLQMACRARGIFHVTVPAPPKVSVFQNVSQSMPEVVVAEDTIEVQSIFLSIPPEAFQQQTSEGVVQKSCREILAVSCSDQTKVLNSSITISDTAGGCQISFIPVPNASGDFQLVASSITNPTDQFVIPVTITAVNDPPVIADISPVLSGEGIATPIAVPIVDDTPGLSCSQAISATSSNQTLLPSSSISAVGTFPDCQITYTPAVNQSGSTEITLTISDGVLEVKKTITVSVTAINDPPTISDISDQTVSQDTVLSGVSVSISDLDSPLTCNSITAISSNTALIPSGNVTISGTAPNCLVGLTPALNQTGSSTITLTVSDTLLTATDTFVLTVNAVNDAPTISDVTDKSTSEDTALTGVAVTIADVDSVLTCSSLSASSSNTALMPNANITVSGTAPNCLVSLTPALNQTGSSTITLTVSDTLLTATDTFVLTVNAVNDAPTISDVTDKSTSEDTALTGVAVTIADVDSVLTCSSLSASSSNTTLIPGANITVSGTAPNCLVSLTPALNQTGSSTITLTVSDTLLTATDTFVLTVNAVNDAPTISDVTDKATAEDTALTVIAVTIADVDSVLTCSSLSASSSNTALMPNANITVSGTAPNCLVSLTPALNQTGSSTITLTVSDTLLTATDTFVLTVNAVNDAPIISDVTDKATAEDTALTGVAVTIADVDSVLTCSSLSASSSNTALMPNANITVSGTAPNCLVSLTPALNQTGSSTITLTVGDTLLTATDTFVLTVNAVNDAPVLSAISSQSTSQDTPTSAIAITITDVDGPNQTCNETYLSYSSQNPAVVSSAGAITWAGTWPSCTAVVTPVIGATGISLIEITVSDGTLTSLPQSFNLQVNSSVGWFQEAYLKASNADAVDYFGREVALSGDTAIVGAYFEDSSQSVITNGATSSSDNFATNAGASYIYRRLGSTWSQEAYLKASNANSRDLFGNAVSIEGDRVIVGASAEDSNQTIITNDATSSLNNAALDSGASYIYKRVGSIWAQEAYLKASNAEAADGFGSSVSIAGDTAIVGARGEDSNQTVITNGTTSSPYNPAVGAGAGYIFRRVGSTWAQEAYLKASNSDSNDFFGAAVSISGDIAVVGAYAEDSNQTIITNGIGVSLDKTFAQAGASYIYRRVGAIWVQEAYVKASNAEAGDQFGGSVSISGDTVIVGASGEDSNQTIITNGSNSSLDNSALWAGASYIYRRTATTWAQEAFIKASNAEASEFFGAAVSISGDTAIVGAYFEDSNQTVITNGSNSSLDNSAGMAGASYVYRRTGTTWAQEAFIKASNANANDYFGFSVSISGDTAIVGAYGEASNQTAITNGTTSSLDNTASTAGAVYVFRNLSRMFEPYEVASTVTTSSFMLSWNGLNLGTGNGFFKVVYSTTIPGAQCSTGTVAYTGTATSVSVTSGLVAGQSYFARICNFDGTSYSEGVTTEFTVKGDDIGPSVLSITRGSTQNPMLSGTSQIDYIVTFDEPVMNLNPENFSLTEVTTNTLNNGQISGISCANTVCIVWVIPGLLLGTPSTTTQLRLDLTNTAAVVDIWGNPLATTKTGDESFTLPTGWAQEAYIKASNSNSGDWFGQAVSISGDTAIVGAIQESSNQTIITNGAISSLDNSVAGSGASYIYKRTGNTWAQEAYIKASNSDPADNFGSAVSISGDTAIVGAVQESSNQTTITNGPNSSADNSLTRSGASYIYKRTGTTWAQEAYIKASNADADDRFGSAVSLSGDTAIVGASYESSSQTIITNGTGSSPNNSSPWKGASYIYRRSGNDVSGYIWNQEAYIKPSNSDLAKYFGSAVSLSGDTAIVGVWGDCSNQTIITNGTISSAGYTATDAGAGYIFRRVGSIWIQEAYLKASNADAFDYFGRTVALSGDTAVVGAYLEDSNQTVITNGTTSSTNNTATVAGASYIYKRTGSNWAQEAYLKASNANANDYFGNSVSISGDTAIVGARGEASMQTFITNSPGSSLDNTLINAGAIYIYKRTSTNWTQEAYVKASNANANDYFGDSVSISSDTALVGAYSESSNETTITNGTVSSSDNLSVSSGAVYIYRSLSRIFEPELRVSAKTTTTITLSWGTNLGSATRLGFVRAVSGNSTPPSCDNAQLITLASQGTFTYGGLAPQTKYGFRVCGLDGANFGEGSVIWEDTD